MTPGQDGTALKTSNTTSINTKISLFPVTFTTFQAGDFKHYGSTVNVPHFILFYFISLLVHYITYVSLLTAYVYV